MLACAQPRVGLLWIKEEGTAAYLAALRDSLRGLGYTDGRNIRVDERFLVDGYDAVASAATRLVQDKPDLIVTYGSTSAHAAHKATRTIPIVIIGGGDPVKDGLAASLSRPGGNLTGATLLSTDLSAKRLELLREVVPSLRRVGVVLFVKSPAETRFARQLSDGRAGAKSGSTSDRAALGRGDRAHHHRHHEHGCGCIHTCWQHVAHREPEKSRGCRGENPPARDLF